MLIPDTPQCWKGCSWSSTPEPVGALESGPVAYIQHLATLWDVSQQRQSGPLFQKGYDGIMDLARRDVQFPNHVVYDFPYGLPYYATP
jgi:hypothetical protein